MLYLIHLFFSFLFFLVVKSFTNAAHPCIRYHMSQRSPFLEVSGKSLTGRVEHSKLQQSQTGGAAKRCKTPLAVFGTGITSNKNAASESAAVPARSPRTSSLSHTPAGDKAKRVATAVSVPHGGNVLEMSLVHNLKQQIACLEAQLRVARQQHDVAARANTRRASRGGGGAAETSNADASSRDEGRERCAIGVALSLPHHERVRHVDAVVGVHGDAAGAAEDEVQRLRSIPAEYQIERAALQHNVESLTKDVEGLQSLALHVGRERDVMAAEVVQFRTALRDSKTEHEAMASECAATLQLLEAERALRRAAEDDAAAYARGGPAASLNASGAGDAATADAVSQRNYYQLQCERFKASVAREKARADSLAAALLEERGRCASLEKQLCSALDRVGLMESREHQLAVYYQNLSARFVTLSAMLRHVLDVVPEDLVKRQQSPHRAGDAAAADDAVSLSEVRETLTAWHEEVLSNAVQLKALVAEKASEQTESKSVASEAAATAGGAVPTVVVALPLSPLPDYAADAQTPPLPLSAAPATPTPALERQEDSGIGMSGSNGSATSAPDIMAVATVATITRHSEDEPILLKPFEKPEKGVLVAAQQYGDAAVAEAASAACAAPLALAAAPAESPPASTADLTAAAGTPIAIPPALYNWASVSEPTPVKSERAEETMPKNDEGDDVAVVEAEGSGDNASGEAPIAAGGEDKPDAAATAPFDPFAEATGEFEASQSATLPPRAVEAEESVPAQTASPAAAALPTSAINVPSLATAPESSSEEEREAAGEDEEALLASPSDKDVAHPSSPPAEAESAPIADPASPSGAAAGTEAEAEEHSPPVRSSSATESRTVGVDNADASATPDGPAPSDPPPPLAAVVPPPPPLSVFVPPPPPPTFAVPVPLPVVPLPPGGVSVPPPPPPPPAAVVPASGPPTAPTPPTLEEQLAALDARIEAQNASLADLVQRHKDTA